MRGIGDSSSLTDLKLGNDDEDDRSLARLLIDQVCCMQTF